MFEFIKKVFFARLTVLSSVHLLTVTPLRCISMTNQECKVRPEIIYVNSDEPVFYPFSIKTSKCSGSCNNINDPRAKLCVPDVIKNINFKVFNLMSRTNETRRIQWNETCKCTSRLDASACNNKQRWNDDNYRCECKELIHKGVCGKGSVWNSSNCEFECDKSCYAGEDLDYENCKCRKKLVDKLVERSSDKEFTENIEEAKIAEIILTECNSVENIHYCSSCTLYIVLFAITFTQQWNNQHWNWYFCLLQIHEL